MVDQSVVIRGCVGMRDYFSLNLGWGAHPLSINERHLFERGSGLLLLVLLVEFVGLLGFVAENDLWRGY